MNEQEVIKYLEYHGYIADEVKDMAIQAIEKRIPKLAELIDRFYDEVRKCPVCGNTVEYQGKEFYCEKCGQKLKWE